MRVRPLKNMRIKHLFYSAPNNKPSTATNMKLRKAVPAFALLFATTACFSQEEKIPDVTDVTKFIFISGFSYEKRIGKFQTLYGKAFARVTLWGTYSSSFGTDAGIYIDPAVMVQYRYYYNARKRQERGKRTDMNSMNYLAAIGETIFSKQRLSTSYYEEDKLRPINMLGIAWGLQRNFRSRVSVDFNAGPGYLFTESSYPGYNGQPVTRQQNKFTLLTQFDIGIWLNRRK